MSIFYQEFFGFSEAFSGLFDLSELIPSKNISETSFRLNDNMIGYLPILYGKSLKLRRSTQKKMNPNNQGSACKNL